MKYTLFAFNLLRSDIEPQLGGPNEIGRALAQTQKHRASICEGVYVFETQKGWHDMQYLRTRLANFGRAFVELPFEEKLAGFFEPSVADRLRELGKSSGQELSLLNFNKEGSE
jgi:hypothetical protein